MKKIIIVESPSKSKTIESYMGEEFKVVASNGHIRDLSTKGKGGLGIDIPAGFIPRYEVIATQKAKVAELKKLCQGNEVYLATDPDREGEAISWHLAQVLELDLNSVNRVEFNEITKNAILEAFSHPRRIDTDLVQSQETRRMLDRIIGFELSTLLQKKIKTKSAGRVQSSVLKLIVDLENEINAFVPEAYYQIKGKAGNIEVSYIDEKGNTAKLPTKVEAENILNQLGHLFECSEIITKETRRESKAPLITSTLQQEASIKYNYSSDRTMKIAQSLYEGKQVGNIHVGLITYMRTDSTRLSDEFVAKAMKYIKETYGAEYCGYVKSKKGTNIQDAHEAIRPTSLERTPEMVAPYLTSEELKIYKLIYNRSISSLMHGAIFDQTTYIFDNNGFKFKATGQKLKFDGYLRLFGFGEEDKNNELPEVSQGEYLAESDTEVLELFTKPKAFFTEATLIKTMEELGIGRPSTYAQTITKLKGSKYIEIKEKKIHPTEAGILSVVKLQEFFSEIIAPKYTANMEETLDKIANNTANNVVELQKFYNEFYPIYEKARHEMEALPLEQTGDVCPQCGAPLVKRQGKYGEFVACSRFPECDYKPKKEVMPVIDLGITCPNCLKGSLVQREAKGKIFYACSNFPKCKTTFSYRPTQYFCDKCGSIMLENNGELVCSNRECGKEEQEGITCPICKKGLLVERVAAKGKQKGKTFWACNQFPKCKTTFFDQPIKELCPVCGSQMVSKGGNISCSKPECEKFIK